VTPKYNESVKTCFKSFGKAHERHVFVGHTYQLHPRVLSDNYNLVEYVGKGRQQSTRILLQCADGCIARCGCSVQGMCSTEL
jgi:hypothetical protein